uniref:Histone H2A n=1 Tax=Homo sapiens TaxID=9606 RepID=A0A7I2YQB9_HUMAN
MSGRSGKKKMSKLSRSARAGVIFPVGRLMRYLKKGTFKYRISVGAPVYMAAVIEYLAAPCSEKSCWASPDHQRDSQHQQGIAPLQEGESWKHRDKEPGGKAEPPGSPELAGGLGPSGNSRIGRQCREGQQEGPDSPETHLAGSCQ